MTSLPPTPPSPLRRVGYLQMAWEFLAARANFFEFSVRLRRRFGTAIYLPFGLPAYLLGEARDLRHILITNPENYRKLGALVLARTFLGNGLLTSDGEEHHRHRRVMQPMFHRQRIQNFATLMIRTIEQRMAAWKTGESLAMQDEMVRATLSIIGLTLFSIDLDTRSRELSRAIGIAQNYITHEFLPSLPLPFLAARRARRCREALADLDREIENVVNARRAPDAPPQDDMLQMLLDIRYEDGGGMSERELRDEIITLFVAGHETTAATLSWAFLLLAQNPDVVTRLEEELDRVLGGRTPTLEDIPQLRYTELVMWETMRMYPVAWMLGRLVVNDELLPSGTQVRAGSQVLILNYAAHRDPVVFSDPEKFRPERFEEKTGLQQGYLPFSAGIRSCVGEPFAKMEMVLIIASVAQKFRFRVPPGMKVKSDLLILLQPRHELRLIPEARTPLRS